MRLADLNRVEVMMVQTISTISPGKPNLKRADQYGPLLRPLIAAAEAGQPLDPIMTRIVQDLGFETFIFAMTTDPQPNHDSRSYVWTTVPREWVAEYDRNAYVEIDPRMTLSWGHASPLIWDAATIEGNANVRAFLDHAAKYGICSGVTVSFSDAKHPRFRASFNSSITPVGPERHEQLLSPRRSHAVDRRDSTFPFERCSSRTTPGQKASPLPREKQCIKLAAHGMTSGDIGIKLEITERTVNFHFSNILSKLDALNRHEAIAKAVQLGIVQLEF